MNYKLTIICNRQRNFIAYTHATRAVNIIYWRSHYEFFGAQFQLNEKINENLINKN